MKSGSYGIQIDAQLDSLRRVWQANEFAKATKPDGADIPVNLCKKRVEGIENAEQRDKALVWFQQFGMLLFLKTLQRDLTCYLVDMYGED